MSKICEICGSIKNVTNNKTFGINICKNCRQKNYRNNTVYEKPPAGEIWYNENDAPICHICGKAFDNLTLHIYQTHKHNIEEYKQMFGLDRNASLLSLNTRQKKHNAIINHPDLIKKNLLESGTNTRFAENSQGRTKDKLRLQTIKRLKKSFK